MLWYSLFSSLKFAIQAVTYRLWWQNRNKDCWRRTYAI
jgi:hypothetical protein